MTLHQRGNVLFLILIAVALFAALSYAVTSTSRSNDGSISEDKARAAAAALIQYGIDVEQKLMRMNLTQGVKWSHISYGGTNSACTDDSCKLFHPSGGGALRVAPDVALNPIHPNPSSQIRFEQIENVGTDLPDLVLEVFGLKLEVCRAVNDILDISNSPQPSSAGLSVVGGSGTHHLSAGSYSPTKLESVTLGAPQGFYIKSYISPPLAVAAKGKRSLCLCSDTLCTNYENYYGTQFLHVLVAR